MMAFANPFLAAEGKKSGNPFFPDDEVAKSTLPLWQRNELMDRLGDATATTGSSVLGALNVPGSLLYDMALGRPLGSGSRGGDVLEATGLRFDEDTLGGWARPVQEFVFEAGTDPLNLVTFGAGAANKAAKAAKSAGLWGDLQRVAGRRLVDDVDSGARSLDDLGDLGYANNTRRSFADNFEKGLGDLTDDDLLSRPLMGERLAARQTRLRDLVDAAPVQSEAIDGINDYLQKHGLQYQDVADDFLGNDIGLDLPRWMGGEIAGRLPGGASVAAGFDRAGQALRWSPVGRAAVSASNLFGDRVQGAVDEGDQILAKSLSRADTRADAISRRANTVLMRELTQASPQVFTDQRLNQSFRNVVEGTASQAEQNLVTNNNLDPFVQRWRAQADDYIARSREAGIGSGELHDPYGLNYFPRAIDDDLYRRGASPATKGRSYSVMTGDQLARDAAYAVPGGTDTINRLSRDVNVQDAVTDADAANHIFREVNALRGAADPEYTMRHAMKLARDMRGMRREQVELGRGMFDSHFTEDWARYVKGRERAIARSNVLYDALGSSARLQNYANVPGTGHHSMRGALADLDLRTIDNRNLIGPPGPGQPRDVAGAAQQVVDRINARLAGTGQQIDIDDLANVSVDQRLVQRLNRIADYYAQPEVQGLAIDLLDGVTRLWKSSILAWPAKFARDWMGGLFSNLVEVGYSSNFTRGYAAAKYIQQGQFDRLEELIQYMPRYARMADANGMQSAMNALRDDLAANGLLSGRRIDDFGTQLTGRQTGAGLRDELLPGANPVTTVGYQVGDAVTGRMPLGSGRAAYQELGNLGGYVDSISRFGRAFNPLDDTVPLRDYLSETQLRDPILRWSARLGDTTDSSNRLAGYFGLMFDGVSPQEATRRMMAAHVDYGNLTQFEKGWMRRIVPFWSFNSRIGAYVVKEIWEKPGGRWSQLGLRAPDVLANSTPQEGDSYTPKQIKENIGFSLEGMRDLPGVGGLINMIAPPTEGVESFLNDVDLPGVGLLNMMKIKRNLDGSPNLMNSAKHTVMDSVGSLAHPGIRMGAELLTGRNLYTGKSLTEFEPTVQKIGRRLGVEPFGAIDTALNLASYPLDFVPHAPRIMQLTNRLIDSERVPDVQARLLQNAINMLSGVKVTNISEDAARLDASRELGEMMGDSPALRTFEQRFIPEELLPYASEEDLQIYRLDRQMRQEARRARKKASDDDSTNPFIR